MDNGIIGFISGYSIQSKQINSKQYEFIVDLGDKLSVVMKTFKKFVRVSIQGATKENFGASLGLLGLYGSGKMVAQDGSTVLENANTFGQAWQILFSEGMLFHNVERPQAPAKCDIPLASNLCRRLGELNISKEETEIACARVSKKDFDMCVFDVMATREKNVVWAYEMFLGTF